MTTTHTQTYTFEDLREKVEAWADARGLFTHGDSKAHLIKVFEELGELSGAFAKSKRADEEDALGDVLVTLIIFAKGRGVDLVEALGESYETIKHRTGKLQNGVFVKTADLPSES